MTYALELELAVVESLAARQQPDAPVAVYTDNNKSNGRRPPRVRPSFRDMYQVASQGMVRSPDPTALRQEARR